MNQKATTSPLEQAIELLGQTGLAQKLGITTQALTKWKRRPIDRQVPASRVLEVERACGGRVSRHELRPDLYPSDEDAA